MIAPQPLSPRSESSPHPSLPLSLSESDAGDDLAANRQLIRDLLAELSNEGDTWHLIPAAYLDAFLNTECGSMDELSRILGPLDCTQIVDSHGQLYAEAQEPVGTYNVLPAVYAHLQRWFGTVGNPVRRCVVFNAATGQKEIERFPPVFEVHSPRAAPVRISVSQTATFGTLVKEVGKTRGKKNQTKMNGRKINRTSEINEINDNQANEKNEKTHNEIHLIVNHNGNQFVDEDNHIHLFCQSQYRVWFIDPPPSPVVPLEAFLAIPNKLLVHRGIFGSRLAEQGVTRQRYHLWVEEREEGVFPVDKAVEGIEKSNSSESKIDQPQRIDSGNLSGDIKQSDDAKKLSDEEESKKTDEVSDDSKQKSSNEIDLGHPVGLSNLGNTCYMNSALQCLLHVPEIRQYFEHNLHRTELNVDNPLGSGGLIARVFAGLVQQVSERGRGAVTPREFKGTVGRYSPMFSGYMQQDSQEFVAWLLDALHEDVNRIHNKPYTEKPELKAGQPLDELASECWAQHQRRNDSVIVDLFSGMYQLTLVCPSCEKKSVTFDPFNDLTLPLPVSRKWYHTFTVVDRTRTLHGTSVFRLEVELDKTAGYDDLVKYLSRFLRVSADHLLLFEIFRGYFHCDFQQDYVRNKFLPIGDIVKDCDDVYVYYVPHEPEQTVVPVVHALSDGGRMRDLIGAPVFAVMGGDLCEMVIETADVWREKKEEVKEEAKEEVKEEEKEEVKEEEKEEKEDKENMKVEQQMEIDETTEDTSDSVGSNSAPSAPTISFKKSLRKALPLQRPNPRDFKRLSDLLSPKVDTDAPCSDLSHAALSDEESQLGSLFTDPLVPASPSASTDEGEVVVNSAGADTTPAEAESVDSAPASALSSVQSATSAPPSVPSIPSSVPSDPSSAPSAPSSVLGPGVFLCEWLQSAYDEYFGVGPAHILANAPFMPNKELEQNKRRLERRRNLTVLLHECLRSFSVPEVLGEHDLWYCPRCREHRQATKSIQVWSTGDILTIHLKRFHSARAFSDKIDMVVDFPIEGLDMLAYTGGARADGVSPVYDLIGVDNHYGGLGGGHYTAYVKSGSRWYYCDDSRVSEVADPRRAVTSAAYLLFYRRRGLLGGAKLQGMVQQAVAARQKVAQQRKAAMELAAAQASLWRVMEEQHEREVQLDAELTLEMSKMEKGNEESGENTKEEDEKEESEDNGDNGEKEESDENGDNGEKEVESGDGSDFVSSKRRAAFEPDDGEMTYDLSEDEEERTKRFRRGSGRGVHGW